MMRIGRGLVVAMLVVSVGSTLAGCRNPGHDGPITTVPSVEMDCGPDRQQGTDADHMSQSASVLYSSDVADDVASWDDITPDTTMTYVDGVLTPDRLVVEAGTMIGIAIPEDGQQGDVAIGCSNARITIRGTVTGFFMAEAGTYPVIDDLKRATVGTIVVE